VRVSEIVFMAEEAPEGGYEAWALGHSIYTQSETTEELTDDDHGQADTAGVKRYTVHQTGATRVYD